jgi:RNA polymerase sigma-70 factor (ECF subfamily)
MADPLDHRSFQEIFRSHREPVFRLLWRLTRDPHGAEDLLQETFVTFWRKRSQFRGDGSLGGYLRRIAFRTFLNARERMAVKKPPQSLDHAPEDASPSTAEKVAEEDAKSFLLAKIHEAVDHLPEGAREAFLLFRFEGLKVAEVAEVTGAPVKTVESRLKRAMELLAGRLRKHRDQLLTR